MDGDGDGSGEPGVREPPVDLPAVLADLEGDEAERREALGTVRTAVDDAPGACAPTIPKLRDLLSGEAVEAATVAYCLAEIAEEAPTDVAPSADAVAAFVAEEHPSPAATEAIRALAAVAEARPEVVADHAARLAEAVEAGPDPDRGSPRLWEALERLGRAVPSIAMTATGRGAEPVADRSAEPPVALAPEETEP